MSSNNNKEKQNLNFDPASFPTDVIDTIFSFIGIREINRIQFTSKSWYNVVIRGRRNLIFRTFPKLDDTNCASLFDRINRDRVTQIVFHSCFLITEVTVHNLRLFPNLNTLTIVLCLALKTTGVALPTLPRLTSFTLKYSGQLHFNTLLRLTLLRELKLVLPGGCHIPPLDPLLHLQELRLPSYEPNASSMFAISQMTQLTRLTLGGITEHEPWRTVTNLQFLRVLKINNTCHFWFPTNNNTTNPISLLGSMQHLCKLTLCHVGENFASLAPLGHLTQLHDLRVLDLVQDRQQPSLHLSFTLHDEGGIFLGAPRNPLFSPLIDLVHLTHFTLEGSCTTASADSNDFYDYLTTLPLTSFARYGGNLTHSDWLGRSVGLRDLTLDIPDERCFQGVRLLTRLTYLSCHSPALTEESAKSVSEALWELTNLTEIELTETTCRFDIPFRRLNGLKKLNLSGCKEIGDENLEGIETASLTYLQLPFTNITNRTIEKLSSMFTLCHLSLNHCKNLTGACLVHLKGLYDLTTIYLNGISIAESDAQYLHPDARTEALKSASIFPSNTTTTTKAEKESSPFKKVDCRIC